MNKELTTGLRVVKDSYSTDHQALLSSYLFSRYSLTFEELKIKYEDVEAVIVKIMECDKNIKRNNFALNVFYDFYVLESEDNFLTFDSYDNKKKVQINYYFQSYEKAKPIFDIIQSFRDDEDELFVNISSFYFNDQKRITDTSTIKNKSDFKKNSLEYYPYLDTKEMFNIVYQEGTAQNRLIKKLLKLKPVSTWELQNKRTKAFLSGPVIAHPNLSTISDRQIELEERLAKEANKMFRKKYPERASIYS